MDPLDVRFNKIIPEPVQITTAAASGRVQRGSSMYKKIGILGGLSPESTSEYYLHIVREFTRQHGDHGYPEIIIYSLSFQNYIDWPKQGRWDLVGEGLSQAARHLEAAGAELIVLATNTMHIVQDAIRASVNVPFLSLLDVIGQAILDQGLHTAGLLGTKFTMEEGFYQQALHEMGIEALIPNAEERELVNSVIYDELVAGIVNPASRESYLTIIDSLVQGGAQGIILGCTEISLLINPSHTPIPLFDTTALHASAALSAAVEGSRA